MLAVQAAHIIAHAAGATTEAQREQQRLWHVGKRIFGPERAALLDALLWGPPAFDDVSNGLPLVADLHWLWDHNYIGFEPLPLPDATQDARGAQDGKTIRVRFHQFQADTRVVSTPAVAVEATAKNVYNMYAPAFKNLPIKNTVGVNNETGRLILTGNVYDISCQTPEERNKKFQLLKARWDLQRILYCAGAAGNTADQFRPFPDEGDLWDPLYEWMAEDEIYDSTYDIYDVHDGYGCDGYGCDGSE